MKLPIEQIKLNQDNPRTITDEKFGKLVKSLKEFPEMAEVREIIVNKDHSSSLPMSLAYRLRMTSQYLGSNSIQGISSDV